MMDHHVLKEGIGKEFIEGCCFVPYYQPQMGLGMSPTIDRTILYENFYSACIIYHLLSTLFKLIYTSSPSCHFRFKSVLTFLSLVYYLNLLTIVSFKFKEILNILINKHLMGHLHSLNSDPSKAHRL